jgi:site-specific DNA recombinase
MLAAWAERTGRHQGGQPCRGGLRFALYGRVSTEDHQDPVTSLARQRNQAAALVTGHGKIVAEFFDIGQSRTLAWVRRPQAAALVAALADPDRGWDGGRSCAHSVMCFVTCMTTSLYRASGPGCAPFVAR